MDFGDTSILILWQSIRDLIIITFFGHKNMERQPGASWFIEHPHRNTNPIVLFFIKGIKKQGCAASGTESSSNLFGRMKPGKVVRTVNF